MATQDVTALLKADHAEVKQLFKQFEKTDDARQKDRLAQQICDALTVHATCEEDLVYPAAREVFEDDDEDLVNEATIEHASAKDLIGQIEAMDADDPMFDATVKVLSEYINHHVEEEEGEMFPRLKKSDLDLDALGVQVAERKQELSKSLGTAETKRKPPRANKQASSTRKAESR